MLVDVRPKVQYDICHLPNSLHIPIDDLPKEISKVKDAMKEQNVTDKEGNTLKVFKFFLLFKLIFLVFVVCRLGNDSQIAVRMMQKEGIKQPKDVIGGLYKWSTKVDDSFPIY